MFPLKVFFIYHAQSSTYILELMKGFEPSTSSLPRKCSTPELHQHTLWGISNLQSQFLNTYTIVTVFLQENLKGWSGRRGSNPRPTAWKAVALPTELLPQKIQND